MDKCNHLTLASDSVLAGLMLVAFTLTSCNCSPEQRNRATLSQDRALELILQDRYETTMVDRVLYISGPPEVVEWVRAEGRSKGGLRWLLTQKDSKARCFAVAALGQIGDHEACEILREWGKQNWKTDTYVSVLCAIRLIEMNDFSLVFHLAELSGEEDIPWEVLLGMGKTKLGFRDMDHSKSPEVRREALKKISQYLISLLAAHKGLRDRR